ncbi:MAG: tetratricopeptide repeat protein [Bacteroidota bacterium]
MYLNYIAVLLFWLGALAPAIAQQTATFTDANKPYQEALSLYRVQQYRAAMVLFEDAQATSNDDNIKANSAYYLANAAIRLHQRGADSAMESFVKQYPTSTKRNAAFLDVADYYFDTGKYPYALKWYKKVDQNTLSRSDLERFNFNTGYAYYSSNRPDQAEQYLGKVSNSPKYGSQAKYYLGYIAYEQDDYDGANARFDQITDPAVLEEKMTYYQADLNFKLGNFKKAIAMAERQLAKSNRKEISELNKIIGESYFNMKQYDQAIPHLQLYKGKRGRWNNTDYYQLGYCYYQQGDFESAIGQFNKIVDGTNAVAQNAYYHLAECYLKLDQKTEALNAFRNASQMAFDPAIEKDALYHYARLSYEQGNPYESVPEVLGGYLKKYPSDDKEQELKELLVDSYITSKNFEGALELLESNRQYGDEATYQKVTFYRGVVLFTEAQYKEAFNLFEKSLKATPDPDFGARAWYWSAEAEYAQGHFDKALNRFKKFQAHPSASNVKEHEKADYQVGYCHFKQKQYAQAEPAFASAVKVPGLPTAIRTDALMRLGDCQYVTSDYRAAMAAYAEAAEIKGPHQDHARLQSAMCHGFLGNTDAKITALRKFLNENPSSTLQDDALFELGNTYVKYNKEAEGLQAYETLLSNFGQSSFAPKALLRQGLVHYNANRNERALEKLKGVVDRYPDGEEAQQAAATVKMIYVDMGQVGAYASWAKGKDRLQVTDAELEEASFEAAERQYIEGNNDKAIAGFETYLKEFPEGPRSTKANFTLAQLYFTKGQKDEALPKYQVVADRGTSEFTEQALTRVCEIYVGKSDLTSALPFLDRLEGSAEIPQNRTFAQSNLMKTYYDKKDYQKTLTYAEKVLKADNIDDRIKADAQIMIARSAIEIGNMELAETAFAAVVTIAKGEVAAEAWYYDAFFKNRNYDFEASNASVQKLAQDYAGYKKWCAKGLIVMAKNFHALEDAFQATYILESVMDNFSDFPELVAEAKGELALIRSKEAERNASVSPEGN